MKTKFSDNYRLKIVDYTCYDQFSPYGVLDVLQDIAGKHSTTFGMAYGDLIVKNQIWVLVRIKYKVLKQIPLFAKLKVVTWPKNKGLVDFDRETQILDENGDIVVNAISKWVIVDVNTRKIIPAKHIEFKGQCLDETNFNEPFTKLPDFEINNCQKYTTKVQFCDIDHNGHANNAKYTNYILNAIKLKEDEIIDKFQIEFVHECYLDDVLNLYYYKEDNIYHIKALKNTDTVFICKIELKK